MRLKLGRAARNNQIIFRGSGANTVRRPVEAAEEKASTPILNEAKCAHLGG